MTEVAHCINHHKRPAEYMCLVCKNHPMCETCKLEHEFETEHATENCKKAGLAIMHKHIQCAGGKMEMDKAKTKTKELAKGLRNALKELEAGLLREIDRFQSSYVQAEEQCSKMQQLDNEGRYAELYSYAKSLPMADAKNEAATGELNKRLLKIIDTASAGLNKTRNKVAPAPQYKPVFAAYETDEVFVVNESGQKEEKVISALHSVDMSKFKAIRINLDSTSGESVTLELAFCLQQAHPISALYLGGRNISDISAEVLAQTVLLNKSLSVLCIAGVEISDTGAKALAEAAKNCPSLTTFYLYGCEISDSGAIAVSEAVKGYPLSVFYLASCKISNAGAIAVAKAIKDRPLSAFCFWSNEISDSGAIAVAKIVKDCPLFAFYIGGVDISDSGAAAVVETLTSGGCKNTLSAFCLESRCLSDSGTKKVADAVRGCTRLSEVYLSGKPISGKTTAYILESMAGVSTIQSVNLYIGEISKEQMDSCLDQLEQSGVAGQLKLRYKCDTKDAENVCKKFAVEWNAKLAKFRIISSVTNCFEHEVILGT
ncbi:MAG: hypothetical protein P4L50_00640 [Anaerolineaceae bacterium]|nr:hypothetical protein [Anaerolineaceae bacterium]